MLVCLAKAPRQQCVGGGMPWTTTTWSMWHSNRSWSVCVCIYWSIWHSLCSALRGGGWSICFLRSGPVPQVLLPCPVAACRALASCPRFAAMGDGSWCNPCYLARLQGLRALSCACVHAWALTGTGAGMCSSWVAEGREVGGQIAVCLLVLSTQQDRGVMLLIPIWVSGLLGDCFPFGLLNILLVGAFCLCLWNNFAFYCCLNTLLKNWISAWSTLPAVYALQ